MATPIYRRIAGELRRQIKSGDLKPGDQLPTELELAERYQASRNTVRDAIRWLSANHLVETQAAAAMRKTCHLPGPVYYSLGKDDRLTVSGLDGRFALGSVQEIRKGVDLAILSMGSITCEAAAAADELTGLGIQATVAVVSNFHPDPDDEVANRLRAVRHVLTVEAHTISGGLASFVASVIASRGLDCRLWALAVRASPDGTSGAQQDRWRKHGLDRHSIVEAARRALDC